MEAKFVTRLRLEEHVEKGESVPGEWVVLEDLVFISKDSRRFTVPRRFITDLASIPKLARGLIDVNDKHRRAAVLHDFLYCAQIVSRAEADRLFLEAMEVLGVEPWKRRVMWAAVRSGGWIYWNRRAKANDLSGDFVGPGYFIDG